MKKTFVLCALLGLAFAQPSFAWEECGKHNGICKNSGKATARYGYNGNWAQVNIKGDIDCSPSKFEGGTVTGDPFGAGIADVDKICEKE